MLGKIDGRRRRGQQRIRWLDGITDSVDMVWVDSSSWCWTGRPGVLQFVGLKESDMTEQLNWISLSLRQHKSGYLIEVGECKGNIYSNKLLVTPWEITLLHTQWKSICEISVNTFSLDWREMLILIWMTSRKNKTISFIFFSCSLNYQSFVTFVKNFKVLYSYYSLKQRDWICSDSTRRGRFGSTVNPHLTVPEESGGKLGGTHLGD